jgi:Mlc titration factor MtfA (ptsG expression regulator)
LIIKIGAHRYQVQERAPHQDGMLNDEAHGYTLESSNLIVLSKDLPLSKKQTILLHEILHAIRFVNDGMPKPKAKDEFEDWEHYFIAMYESNLLAVLKDNPHLVEWLMEDGNMVANSY